MDWTFALEWLGFAVRWLHVVTAIAWIGSSFYFIALDLGLRPEAGAAPGVKGAAWQVHGGGFYHIRKFLVAPPGLPADLTWFKWESYATWLSGFALLVLVYYLGAEFYLIDPDVAALSIWQAVAISTGSLVLGWLAYDALCRSPLGHNSTVLMLGLYVVLVAVAWGYAQLFSGRAALLHLGAFTATIMSANVFMVIIPNQKTVVADLVAGRVPDPKYGVIAKQRSTHNNYLTLPVVFLMLSNHYPLAFANDWNWLIAALVFLMGVTIRHWFNRRHAGFGAPWWTWAATIALGAAISWLSLAGVPQNEGADEAALSPVAARFAATEGFDEVTGIVLGRCSMCHAVTPGYPGVVRAPKALILENPVQIAREARRIYLHAGLSAAMPPANLSFMELGERAAIVKWYRLAQLAEVPR